MKRLMQSVATAALASLGSGCAYLTTYTRSIDLQGASSVAMDVKQRVVISQLRPGDAAAPGQPPAPPATVVCAEPSPDALTVLGASGGLSFSDGLAEKSANVSAALSESGAFVGLRTQSIQLLRDAMYRLCEGYAGQAVDADEFVSMQRRYQSTMMGLIAIEQLTRPVVAGQAALAAGASASAGAGAGDPAVKEAQARVDQQTAALDEAKDAERRADAKQKEAQQKLNDNDAQNRQAEADKDQTRKDQLQQERPALLQALNDARLEAQAARDKRQTAQEAARKAGADLNAARSRSAAAASGSAQLGGIGKAVTDNTKELAEGVTDIVKEINYSYTREGCLNLVTQLARSDPSKAPLVTYMKSSRSPGAAVGAGGSSERIDMISAAFDMCKDVILSSVDRWNAASLRKLQDAEARKLAAQAQLVQAQAKSAQPAAEVRPEPTKKPAAGSK